MTKPTYEELLEALFGVTQALRNTLLHACNLTDAEKDTSDGPSRTTPNLCATPAGTLIIGGRLRTDPMKRPSRPVTWLRRLWHRCAARPGAVPRPPWLLRRAVNERGTARRARCLSASSAGSAFGDAATGLPVGLSRPVWWSSVKSSS